MNKKTAFDRFVDYKPLIFTEVIDALEWGCNNRAFPSTVKRILVFLMSHTHSHLRIHQCMIDVCQYDGRVEIVELFLSYGIRRMGGRQVYDMCLKVAKEGVMRGDDKALCRLLRSRGAGLFVWKRRRPLLLCSEKSPVFKHLGPNVTQIIGEFL
jgi:hypothetical protein